MAAASGTTTLPPTSSAQGEYAGWKYASSGHPEDHMQHKSWGHEASASASSKNAFATHNGDTNHDPYAADGYPATRASRSNSWTTVSEHKRPHREGSPMVYDDENSKWIHRDKLAKIESQELQAAGIILPKPRAQSRPRRERSPDKMNGNRRGTDASDQQSIPRPRKDTDLGADKTTDFESPSWDLRLPEEIAEDPSDYWVSNDSGKKSRIPVAKLSPAPIPVDFLDRDAPALRRPSFHHLDGDNTTSLPKARSRSGSANALDMPKLQPGKRAVTEGSPKKGITTTARKASAPAKSATQARPRTRNGPTQRSGSTARPTTRSGELSPKAPEGEPPWMISAYKPDPRLPPDQQLLPTVAKRLQQEKWEQEGTFGSVYDKEFRPLNDEAFAKPPELEKPRSSEEPQNEWPLRPDVIRPDARTTSMSRPGTSSYSTMPKIQDKPVTSPLGSPMSLQQPQFQAPQITRVQEPPKQPQPQEKPQKAGCGCCIMM
ncbi:Uu.00g094740.m01.CDS01 [Anthostomella pinea]|uniref:Uu.00g094740.m01.CDS01 n=1 Tax=Anthostomella pinea TaxID=933095 RepID=A0AAI8VI91_9PEZI|nr:Uu.00g094740.m01.CDS01 [Anthostomella pinea]